MPQLNGKKKKSDNADLLEFFKQHTGFPDALLQNLGRDLDPVFIQNVHNVMSITALNHTAEVDQLVDLMGWEEYFKMHAGGKYVGGPLLRRIGDDMSSMVAGSADAVKYIQHSGHDSTILALLAASGLDQNTFLNALPRYASAVIFELWEDNFQFTVNVKHRDGVTQVVSDLIILDNNTTVPFSNFRELTETQGMASGDWCNACWPDWDPENTPATCLRLRVQSDPDDSDEDEEDKLRKVVVAVSVLLVVTAVALFVMIFLWRRKNRSTVRLLTQ